MTTDHLDLFWTRVRLPISPFKPYFIGLFYYLKIIFSYANILSMNKIENIEQYASALTDTFATLRLRGDVAIPCPAPQPWNDSRFATEFAAEAPRYRVPEWQFSSRPVYNTVAGVNCFQGLRLSVQTAGAGMSPPSKTVIVSAPEEIAPALDALDTFRREALNRCRHNSYRLVANLGRCYNRYECKDCGAQFEIDSGD